MSLIGHEYFDSFYHFDVINKSHYSKAWYVVNMFDAINQNVS